MTNDQFMNIKSFDMAQSSLENYTLQNFNPTFTKLPDTTFSNSKSSLSNLQSNKNHKNSRNAGILLGLKTQRVRQTDKILSLTKTKYSVDPSQSNNFTGSNWMTDRQSTDDC